MSHLAPYSPNLSLAGPDLLDLERIERDHGERIQRLWIRMPNVPQFYTGTYQGGLSPVSFNNLGTPPGWPV